MRAAIIVLLAVVPAASAQARTQVFFKEPAGIKVFWLTTKDGKTSYSKVPLETPGRFNFVQGASYRLKLTHLPGHAGLELFPTLEVAASSPRVQEFLAHNSVPITLTEGEINQVVKGNFLVKVVHLPTQQGGDPEVAVVSGKDAVQEAVRRGSVLLVLRVGNIIPPEGK
jgi:hypothetical protein